MCAIERRSSCQGRNDLAQCRLEPKTRACIVVESSQDVLDAAQNAVRHEGPQERRAYLRLFSRRLTNGCEHKGTQRLLTGRIQTCRSPPYWYRDTAALITWRSRLRTHARNGMGLDKR